MTPRSTLLLLLGGLLGAAQAGLVIIGNPSGLHRGAPFGLVQVGGWISKIKLHSRHGETATIRLPRPVSLDETLTLPPGDWTALTLVLEGPLTLSLDGGAPVPVATPELTVVLEDPDAREIHLEWSLPEGALSALRSGVTPAGLTQALENGALAVNARLTPPATR